MKYYGGWIWTVVVCVGVGIITTDGEGGNDDRREFVLFNVLAVRVGWGYT